ncbi:GNAT family N-acetyltransferase, partial [Bacillus sp. D-CC]
MFTLRVDDEIELQLLEKHHKEELYQLINQNRLPLQTSLTTSDKSHYKHQQISSHLPKEAIFLNGYGFESGIRYKGKLVGMVGIHPVSWGKKAASLGYYLAEDAGGKGI